MRLLRPQLLFQPGKRRGRGGDGWSRSTRAAAVPQPPLRLHCTQLLFQPGRGGRGGRHTPACHGCAYVFSSSNSFFTQCSQCSASLGFLPHRSCSVARFCVLVPESALQPHGCLPLSPTPPPPSLPHRSCSVARFCTNSALVTSPMVSFLNACSIACSRKRGEGGRERGGRARVCEEA